MASNVEVMVFAVSSFPLNEMLNDYRSCMSKPQFKHLVTFVAGLMLKGRGEKNVMDIATNALDDRSQSSLNRFLHGQVWPEAVEWQRLEEHTGGHKSGVLVLDDTLIEKSGREIEGTGYLYDHSQNRNVWCHCYGHRYIRTAMSACRCTWNRTSSGKLALRPDASSARRTSWPSI